LAFTGLAWWLLWRKSPSASGAVVHTTSIAERIATAASGVPTPEEIGGWPPEKLRTVYGRLLAADNYEVLARSEGDGEFALTRKGDVRPTVVVSVQAGAAGQVSVKKVRELFGTITVEDIPKGWFVGPAGFSAEAHEYASRHSLVLIDAVDIVAQLRALPEVTLHQVLRPER
jgi:hypothetical protein